MDFLVQPTVEILGTTSCTCQLGTFICSHNPCSYYPCNKCTGNTCPNVTPY